MKGRGKMKDQDKIGTAETPAITGNGEPVVGGNITAINGSTLTITNKSNVTYTIDATNATIIKSNATINTFKHRDRRQCRRTRNGKWLFGYRFFGH